MIEAQQIQGEQPSQYLPAGPPDPLIFEAFDGMNTATLRPGVDDKEAAWLDGFMPLGPMRNLRTLPDVGPKLFDIANTASASATIALFAFANIGATPYMIVVATDGAIYAVNTNTRAITTVAAAGTIQNPSQLTVGLTQYGSQYVIIVSKQTNGYFIWTGSGLALLPGQSFLTGTIPLGISGTAIEVYAGRVWIANGATITFSAPGSVIDFSSGSGGGNFTSSDSFLRVQFTQLKQTNGFLYLIGDSSINYISGVQTSGSPPVTTFTNQNADPEVGTPWPNTVTVFNRNILFANSFGAHVSYGGAVTKISEKLDGVYNTAANFANLTPSSAKAIVYGKKCFILLLPIVDPISGQTVNQLFMWNEKFWWSTKQSVSFNYIQVQEINSVLTAYGSNGTQVYPLFQTPSVNFTKIAQSKLWDKPGGYQFTKFTTRIWGIVKFYSNLSQTINVALDNETVSNNNAAQILGSAAIWLTLSGLVSAWTTLGGATSIWIGAGAYTVLSPDAVAQQGVLTGFTLSTQAADVAIVSMMIQNSIAGYRG